MYRLRYFNYIVSKLSALKAPVFVLCLDWLYLLNLVSLNNQGNVELCS
ncbi:MAG: ABC-three component system middle component 6 [Desulfuromonadales bacterium]